jgi:hypothetical protein
MTHIGWLLNAKPTLNSGDKLYLATEAHNCYGDLEDSYILVLICLYHPLPWL